MSQFDFYLERLRERAGLQISPDAERELRAHFDEAVTEQLASGRSRAQAELIALEELGQPEIVGKAFRQIEGVGVRRFAGAPGGLLVSAWRHWRMLLISMLLAAGLGTLIGQTLPPTYVAYVTLSAIPTEYDYGNFLGAQYALTAVKKHVIARVDSTRLQGTVMATGTDPATAATKARASLATAQEDFRQALQRAPYGGRDTELQVVHPLTVVANTPAVPAGIAGGFAGLLVGALLARRRSRRGA